MTDFLSLACDDDAFGAASLRTLVQILALTVPEYIGTKSSKLKWKEHMRAVPIFRHTLTMDLPANVSLSLIHYPNLTSSALGELPVSKTNSPYTAFAAVLTML